MRCPNCGNDNPQGAQFCGSCGRSLAVVRVPGVSASYAKAWRKLWPNFLELFLILVIPFVFSIPSFLGRTGFGGSIIAWAYSILVEGPIGFGVAFAYLKAARGDKPEVKDIFAGFGNYWNAVLASLLVGAIVLFGLLMLIVPGIIFGCKLAFTPFLIVDRKMEVIAAVKESWRLTNGHAWKVFLIGLLGLPISIVGLIAFGVGVIIAVMWINLALASLYHAVATSKQEPSPVVVPPST